MTLLMKARQNRLNALKTLAARERNIFADLPCRPAPVHFATRRVA